MVDTLLTAVGLLSILVAALSERMRRMPVSAPLLALVTGIVLGPSVSGALAVPDLTRMHGEFHDVSRILLAVSVMAVALRYPLSDVRRQLKPMLILLAVAMPVMATTSSLLAATVLGVGLGTAVLIGAALSPTDPVLASSVVTGGPAERHLPARDRQVLSLESGANDGLAMPLVLVALAAAAGSGIDAALLESLWQIVGGAALGALCGWVGGRALRAGEEHGAVEPGPAVFFTILLAFAVLGASGLLRVDGVLAVFMAGLLFNGVSTGGEREGAAPVDEAVNRLLVLPLFLLLGAAFPWQHVVELGWQGLAFALGVLLFRRLPILLALRRPLELGRADAAYLGWFGPVGVSAIFYLTLEAQRLGIDTVVLAAGSLVVVTSTIAHGLTSSLGVDLYARRRAETRRTA